MNTIQTAVEHIVSTDSSIQLVGESKIARQRYVSRNSSSAVVAASFNLGGKIGKEIRHSAILAGRAEIQNAVRNGNFRPLAQFLALQFGESVYIRNQADFFSLDSRMQTFVDSARSGKNLGMRVNKKTGEETIGAKLADALELQSFVLDLISITRHEIEARKAARAAEIAQVAETAIL